MRQANSSHSHIALHKLQDLTIVKATGTATFRRRGGREPCSKTASGIFPNEFRGFALLLPASHDGLARSLLPIASHLPDARRTSSPGGRLRFRPFHPSFACRTARCCPFFAHLRPFFLTILAERCSRRIGVIRDGRCSYARCSIYCIQSIEKQAGRHSPGT